MLVNVTEHSEKVKVKGRWFASGDSAHYNPGWCDTDVTDVTQMWQMWRIHLYLDLFHHLTLMDLLTTILVDVTQHPPEIAMAWWGPQLYTAPIFKCSKSSFSHLLAPCSSHKCICKWNCKEIWLLAKWEEEKTINNNSIERKISDSTLKINFLPNSHSHTGQLMFATETATATYHYHLLI